jgi:hypothetical protein
MDTLLTFILIISLLNLAGLALLFRSLIVTNVKIEEEVSYRKEIKEKLIEIVEMGEKQERLTSTSIGVLNKIVELL